MFDVLKIDLRSLFKYYNVTFVFAPFSVTYQTWPMQTMSLQQKKNEKKEGPDPHICATIP